ncbi:hypothetical protein VPH35_041657 [Triticum aestivum]|uniref:Uncharacterized protein n=1 Tax=Aegilops tauschii TaxID=37682 RepID=M8AIB7_AEGTA
MVKSVPSKWFNLSRLLGMTVDVTIGTKNRESSKTFASRIHLKMSLEMVYQRARRADALQQRPAAGSEKPPKECHRRAGGGHPQRARHGRQQEPLLRCQVGAHAHAAGHRCTTVERAVHL